MADRYAVVGTRFNEVLFVNAPLTREEAAEVRETWIVNGFHDEDPHKYLHTVPITDTP